MSRFSSRARSWPALTRSPFLTCSSRTAAVSREAMAACWRGWMSAGARTLRRTSSMVADATLTATTGRVSASSWGAQPTRRARDATTARNRVMPSLSGGDFQVRPALEIADEGRVVVGVGLGQLVLGRHHVQGRAFSPVVAEAAQAEVLLRELDLGSRGRDLAVDPPRAGERVLVFPGKRALRDLPMDIYLTRLKLELTRRPPPLEPDRKSV